MVVRMGPGAKVWALRSEAGSEEAGAKPGKAWVGVKARILGRGQSRGAKTKAKQS